MVSEVDRRVNLKEPWMVSLTESEEKRSSGGKAPAAGPLEQDTRQVTNPFDGPDHLPRRRSEVTRVSLPTKTEQVLLNTRSAFCRE